MTKKGVLERISKLYFQGIADDITNAEQISAIYPNASDVGDIRENILKSFLIQHLPARCSVTKGGFIFDSLNNESKQMDIIVTHDAALNFAYFDRADSQNKKFQNVEGCLAAVTVKSTLEKDALHDALTNLASIPKMPESIFESINPGISNREQYLLFPKKIVFAFEGASVQTVLKHVNEFYSKKSFEDYKKADLIIVNNSFSIVRVREGAQTRNGSKPKSGTYHAEYKGAPEEIGKTFGTLPLLRLLTIIQEAAQFPPNILYNYNDYINAMNFHE